MTITTPPDTHAIEPLNFHILIVEDEEDLRELIAEELSDAGYTTRQAFDGADGLRSILEDPPHLVLCDITMPNMNGYELLKEVRQNEADVGDVDFVFLSALAEKEEVLEGLRLGADDYLTKPLDYELLRAKVEGRLREIVRRQGARERQLVKLYKSFMSKEKSAVGDGEAQTAPAATTLSRDKDTSQPAQSTQPQAVDSAQFKEGLARIARENANHIVTGHIQTIGLDGLKERLGEKWPRVAERVNQTAERTIRSRLTPQDVLTRNSDGDYVICFAQLSEQAAATKAQALSNEIWNKLLGETPEAESLTVTAAVHTLEMAPEEIEQEEDLLSTVTSRVAELAERVKGQAKAMLAELHRTAKLKLQPVRTGSGKATALVLAAFDSLSKANVDYLTLAKGNSEETVAEIDALTLGKVCEQIYGNMYADKTLVVTPVNYQTIRSTKLANKFYGLCDHLLPAVRERLVFNVKGVPQNLLSSDMSIAQLSAYSKYRMLQLDSTEFGNVDLHNLRVNLICVPYNILRPLLRAGHPQAECLIERAHKNKARVLVYDIPLQAKDTMNKIIADFLSFRED